MAKTKKSNAETPAEAGIGEGRYCELPVDSITVAEDHNPREVFEEQQLLDLGQSIQENTQLQPVIVNRVGKENLLVIGERRLRAAKAAGIGFVKAMVFEDLSPLAAHRMAMAENRDRVSLNPLEQAKGYQRWLELGESEQDIARSEHVAIETVQRRLKLLKLPEDVQRMLVREQNPLPIHQALMLLKVKGKSEQIQMAREAAPITGPILTEEQLKAKIDEKAGQKKLFQAPPEEKDASPAEEKCNVCGKTPCECKEEGWKETPSKAAKKKELPPAAKAKVGIAGKLEVEDSPAGNRVVMHNATLTVSVEGTVKLLNCKKIILIPDDASAGEVEKQTLAMLKAQAKAKDKS